MSDAPLELSLSPTRPVLRTGEGATLEVAVRVLAGGPMETIELNEDRTTIELRRLDAAGAPGDARLLTGRDHRQLHQVHPQTPLGLEFEARGGAAFVVRVDLLLYAPPLPAGRWRVALRYRWGSAPGDEVRTNDVDLEVTPADARPVGARLLAVSGSRDVVAWTWRVDDPAAPFRVTLGRADVPLALEAAYPWTDPPPAGAPRLAHLNDLEPMHYEKLAVWTEAAELVVQPLGKHGPGGPPRRLATGLEGPLTLVDPPLQRRDDGLRAVVLGRRAGAPALSVVACGPDGAAAAPEVRAFDAGDLVAVAWTEPEDTAHAGVFAARAGAGGLTLTRLDPASGEALEVWREEPPAREALALVLDQWLGTGWLYLLLRRAVEDPDGRQVDELTALAWDVAALSERPDDDDARRPARAGAWLVPRGAALLSAAPLLDGAGLALLVSAPPGRLALVPGGPRELPAAAAPGALLVDGRGQTWLVEHDPARGPVATALGRSLVDAAPDDDDDGDDDDGDD